MPRESTLQNKVIDYLESIGAYVFNVAGTGMGRKGTPDLLICYRGKFIAIEVKMPGGKTSKLQEYELAKVRKAGGIAKVIHSMEELEHGSYNL